MYLIACLLIGVIFSLWIWIKPERVLSIGLIADFSSKNYQLGVQSRNGAQMAIEEINADGGIEGLLLKLETKGNKNDPSMNEGLIEEFVSNGTSIIIGPHRSVMMDSFRRAMDIEDLIVISPVVNTDKVAGLNDDFFMINSLASSSGRILGEALSRNNDKSIAIVWSLNNKDYSSYVVSEVKNILDERSIPIVYEKTYSDKSELMDIVEFLNKTKPEGIVFSLNGEDASLIIQQLAKQGTLPHLYGCEWVKNTGILSFGGKTVEEMVLVGTVNNSLDKKKEIEFNERYKRKYSLESSATAVFAYESVFLLVEAIRRSGKSTDLESIRSELVNIDNYPGVLGPIGFDVYGDSIREKGLFVIKNNAYVQY